MTQKKLNLLHNVLHDHPAKFGFITDNAAHFRFQALLSQVTMDSRGRPSLVRHGYRVDQEYFYPASAIKLCAAVAALYKLKDLQKSLELKVTCSTPLSFYPLLEGEKMEQHDPTNIHGSTITVAHEIRKLFLVSDNVAFNRLYALTGQQYMNTTMWHLGLWSTRLRHRLLINLSIEENRHCEPIELTLGEHYVTLPPKKNRSLLPNCSTLEGLKVGNAHLNVDEDLILQPMDFSGKNSMSLLDLQNLLVKIFWRDVELDGQPVNMSSDMHRMLMEAMSQYPSESLNPEYDKSEYPDDYCKLFLPGLCRVTKRGGLRVFNKAGRAYGFTVENAYIFDKEIGAGFFLSAVIYTNANGVINDDKYEYCDIADRVMADLAEMVTRSVWHIPQSFLSVSSPYDCTPSFLSQAPSKDTTTLDAEHYNHGPEKCKCQLQKADENAYSTDQSKCEHDIDMQAQRTLESAFVEDDDAMKRRKSELQALMSMDRITIESTKHSCELFFLPDLAPVQLWQHDSRMQGSEEKTIMLQAPSSSFTYNEEKPLTMDHVHMDLISKPSVNKESQSRSRVAYCYKYFLYE